MEGKNEKCNWEQIKAFVSQLEVTDLDNKKEHRMVGALLRGGKNGGWNGDADGVGSGDQTLAQLGDEGRELKGCRRATA